jgi:hypothetical protein
VSRAFRASRAAAAALAGLAAAGCTGIFHEPLPDAPARFERRAVGAPLRAGFASADITPVRDLYLGGFDLARVSTGIHSRLQARALVLELGDMRVAVVGIDNLGLQRQDVEWIKSGLVGFQNGCVFLCSSHTHAAPDLVGFWGWYFASSGRDRDYLARVRHGVAEAVAAAAARLRPAEFYRGEARIPLQGLVRNSNRFGLFDRRLTLLQARDAETGAPLGALLHMGCHPEVLRRGNTLVSSDFVGALCDSWAAAGLGQAVFVNGALGAMVTPQPSGTDGISRMAEGLLAVARRALATAEPVPVADIEVRRRDVYMPLTAPGLLLGRLTLAIPRPAYGGQLRTSVGYLRIGEVEAVCVPGETEPTLAERLRRTAGKPNLLLLGLVDDEVGYLMREVDARDPLFGYERLMSPVVDAGERIAAALVGMAR